MASFDEVWNALKTNVVKYSEDNWNEFKDDAINDGKDFLEKCKDDLMRWTDLLSTGKLTQDDFEWLLLGKKDLAEMEALKQKGMAKKKLSLFQKGLLDTVKTTVIGIINIKI